MLESKKYPRREIACCQCGRVVLQSAHSAKGKFCSNSCQMLYQRDQYIAKWKRGDVSGISGKLGISRHVRSYMLDKVGHKCELCGWGEKHPCDGRVPLDIDHIDGDHSNTTEGNLRVLCPNCHSLTPTYKSRNRGKSTRAYKKVK